MYFLVIIGLFLFEGSKASAQYVGFNNNEIVLLRHSLVSPYADTSLMKLYQRQKELADQALAEPPHPVDTIRSEGLLQGDPKKTATQQALKDMGKMYALALLYRLTGDTAYLQALERSLGAWAETDKPRGDPIDDTNLDPLIGAYDMAKGKLPAEEEKTVQGWLRLIAQTEITAVYNQPNRATSYNNWHSHRLKIIGEIGFAADDTALEGYAVRGLKAQIGRNLLPDGSSEDFVTRDALHYHVYDLEPLLKLAIVLKRATGVDWYRYVAPTGSSIAGSVTWLFPYLTGQKTHAEFVKSTVEFDRRRAQNSEAAYKAGSLFEPKNADGVLELAAYFDPGLMSLARRLAGTKVRFPSWTSVADHFETSIPY